MASYEIEIKCLLGSPERAERLRKELRVVDPKTTLISKHKQLNHYFEGGDISKLHKLLSKHLTKKEAETLEDIIKESSDYSIRTRLADETLIFVLKASRDEGTSHNTVVRLEFEAHIKEMTLDELDQLLLKAGFQYQAKWSREREEYTCGDINVSIDKNAGYGYLAEFEKVVDSDEEAPGAQREIRNFMNKLNAEELPQDRLERMFAYYNAHWPDYYGTDKIFVVE